MIFKDEISPEFAKELFDDSNKVLKFISDIKCEGGGQSDLRRSPAVQLPGGAGHAEPGPLHEGCDAGGERPLPAPGALQETAPDGAENPARPGTVRRCAPRRSGHRGDETAGGRPQ